MSRELLRRAVDALDEHFVTTDEGKSLLKDIEYFLEKPLPEPVTHQFQDTDGSWHDFINPDHYKNTVKDGRWPIRALYAEQPAINQWRPIETAPKDGTEVLLFSVFDIGLCYWSDEMKCWTWGAGKKFLNPSHWMPLPEHPKAKI